MKKQWAIKSLTDTYIARVNGDFIETKDKNCAACWATPERAAAVLNASLPPETRYRFFVGKISDSKTDTPEELSPCLSDTLENETPVAPVLVKTPEAAKVKPVQQYVSKVEELSTLMQNLPNRKAELEKEQKRLEGAICDIQHYIELGNFGGSEGWKAYKLLQSYLKKRREVKDAVGVLEAFEKSVNSQLLEDTRRSIIALETRYYHPRELPDLFKGHPDIRVRK